MNDYINSGFALAGAYMTWRSVLQLWRDRTVAGVYWPANIVFGAWGLWNLYYYPSLGQWSSFVCGSVNTLGNLVWVGLVLKWRKCDY